MAFLITLYEEERARLEILIKECLDGFDGPEYLLAHHHQKALYIVDDTIRKLRKLEDNQYDDKQFCLTFIARFEKDIQETDSEYLKTYYSDMLQVYKEKLERLNSSKAPSQAEASSGVLEEALVNLISKKIKKLLSFSIGLKKFR